MKRFKSVRTPKLAAIGLLAMVALLVGACADSGDSPVDSTRGSEFVSVTDSGSTTTSDVAPATTVSTTAAPTTTTTTTTTEPPRIWDGLERLNIMLLGSDAGVGRTGTRTDTVIVVSIAPESGDAAMFSVPRNLTEAPLPEGMGVWSCNCFPDIITHLWANAEWYPDAFPGAQEPPINALKAALGGVFGVDIHYYAKVDLAGFVDLFDAIGGVTLEIPKRIVDSSYPHEDGGRESVLIEAGEQVLDGHQALAYGRIRRNSGDFARMHRQRCLLGALLESTDASSLAASPASFVEAVGRHVETDIPLDSIGDFVELLSRIEMDRFATLRITSHKYGTSGHAGYQIYDLEQIRTDAHTLMDDPTVHLDTQDGEGWEDTCAQSFD